MAASRLSALPLAAWERDGLQAALVRSGLPAADVGEADRLFWRFETTEDVPIGFGGIELHGREGLLRSVVILPPLRRHGYGTAVVAVLELEAQSRGCRMLYLLAPMAQSFCARLGYLPCVRASVPEPVRASREFAAYPSSTPVLAKALA
jgi:amino-acid N-acetyltransferase